MVNKNYIYLHVLLISANTHRTFLFSYILISSIFQNLKCTHKYTLWILCLVLHTTKVVTLYQLSKEFDEFLECSLTWKYVPYWYKKHIYLHQDIAILDNFVSRYHKTRRGITFSYLIDILVCLVYRLQMYLYLWKRCSCQMCFNDLIHFLSYFS